MIKRFENQTQLRRRVAHEFCDEPVEADDEKRRLNSPAKAEAVRVLPVPGGRSEATFAAAKARDCG
jgi:hypothetical protein